MDFLLKERAEFQEVKHIELKLLLSKQKLRQVKSKCPRTGYWGLIVSYPLEIN
jgi:hypothetical protein